MPTAVISNSIRIREIEQLRQQGLYDEAYAKAVALHHDNPNAQWAHNQLGWCLYYLMRTDAENAQPDTFIAHLQELTSLNRTHTLTPYITRALVWPIRKHVATCLTDTPSQEANLNSLFDLISTITFDPADENYGILLSTFIKAKQWSRLKEFILWWNLDNIKPRDCQPYVTDNGTKIMSVAEQAYIAYSNILLRELETDTADSAQVADHITRLSTAIDQHPDFQYPSYFRARLLLASGHPDEAREALLPFVRRKSNDYWVWDLLGDASSDADMQIACYCKALTCHSREQYLRKLHFKLCDLLLQRQLHDLAATELNRASVITQRNGWSMPYKYYDYTTQQWYLDAHPLQDNRDYYTARAPLAEELLYSDMPSHTILITHINQAKQIANFITADHTEGFFSCRHHKCTTGQAYTCHMQNDNGNHYIVYTCQPADAYSSGLMLHYDGQLKKTASGIGFVGQTFIPRELVAEHKDGTQVCGDAILSYDHKKQKWGWRAISLSTKTN